MKCKVLLLLLFTTAVLLIGTAPVFASPAIAESDTFTSLPGDGKYLSPSYRDNYALDLRECTLLEKGYEALNGIDNAIFQWMRTFSYTTIVLVDACFNFNVADLFGSQIEELQKLAKETIFDELFLIAFCFAAVNVIKNMARRNLSGAFGDIAKVLLATCLSVLLVTHSAQMLTAISSVTRDVSVGMITKAVGSNGAGISKDAAGVLWSVMVHRPFIDLEGGTYLSENQVSTILTMPPGSAERTAYIRSINSSNGKVFGLDWPAVRLGKLLVLILPIFIKNLTFTFLAILQIVFQFFGLILFFTASFVLLFAVARGPQPIENWFKRLVETQVSIIILTMVIVLLVKLDQLLYQQASTLGWLIILIIQTGVCVYAAIRFNHIIGLVSGMMQGQTPLMRVPDLDVPRSRYNSTDQNYGNTGSSRRRSKSRRSSSTSNGGPDDSGTGPDAPTPAPSPGGGTVVNMREIHQKHMQQMERPVAVHQSIQSSGANRVDVPSWNRGDGNLIHLHMAPTGTDGGASGSGYDRNPSRPSKKAPATGSPMNSDTAERLGPATKNGLPPQAAMRNSTATVNPGVATKKPTNQPSKERSTEPLSQAMAPSTPSQGPPPHEAPAPARFQDVRPPAPNREPPQNVSRPVLVSGATSDTSRTLTDLRKANRTAQRSADPLESTERQPEHNQIRQSNAAAPGSTATPLPENPRPQRSATATASKLPNLDGPAMTDMRPKASQPRQPIRMRGNGN